MVRITQTIKSLNNLDPESVLPCPRLFKLLCMDVNTYRNRDSAIVLTSMKTNKRTVLGARRMNAGVHPLNRNLTPSSLRDVFINSSTEWD